VIFVEFNLISQVNMGGREEILSQDRRYPSKFSYFIWFLP